MVASGLCKRCDYFWLAIEGTGAKQPLVKGAFPVNLAAEYNMRNVVVYLQSHRNCGQQIMLFDEGALMERHDPFAAVCGSTVPSAWACTGGQIGYRANDRMILTRALTVSPPARYLPLSFGIAWHQPIRSD
jgi:hypothetical protein